MTSEIKATKESVRVQLYKEDREQLSRIAAEHGCFYDRKGNLSLLLTKIAQGKLTIQQPSAGTIKDNLTSSVPLISLEVKVITALNGIIAKVAEKIAAFGGNIYDIKSREPDPIIRITFHLNNDKDLNQLVESLKSIKVKNIWEFNRDEKLENLLYILDPEMKRCYDLLKQNNGWESSRNSLIEEISKNIQDNSIVEDIVIIIAFRAEIKNTPGGLATVATELAKKYISILEIDQKVDPEGQKNIADLYLGFYPRTQGQPLKEINDIKTFTKNLKKLDCIENIYQLNIIK